MDFIHEIIKNVRVKKPLVHNITNYVTVNDCANMILACGGSPIMADDALEVDEITSICNALVINIGTLNSRTIESMIIAGKRANELKIPVILDPVGVGASILRTKTAKRLLSEIKFSVIRGNISEIKTLAIGTNSTVGVDANDIDKITDRNLEEGVTFAKSLSKDTGSIIAITGTIDIVVDENRAYIIKNGQATMGDITGAGCMLTSIMGAFCGANEDNILKAVTTATISMGICGELAYEKIQKLKEGNGSFKVYMIDFMSQIEGSIVDERMKVEIK